MVGQNVVVYIILALCVLFAVLKLRNFFSKKQSPCSSCPSHHSCSGCSHAP
ncbi:MAG: FeoB-associated Cys-rich membrane protein [Prevotellaceae bacterium]|nr:FeoB-associated Cys-rich membrane protein [Prevotellaceae bacterium]